MSLIHCSSLLCALYSYTSKAKRDQQQEKKLLNKISRTSDRYELKDKTNVETFSVEKYISRYQKLDINVCVSWNQFSDSVAINNHFFSMSRFPKAKTRRRKNEFMEKRKGEVLRFEVNI